MHAAIGLHKNELDTPCLVIDKDKLLYNLRFMQEHGLKHQVAIRPHSKTHKCSRLAQLQMDFGAIGICTAKISEAKALISAGLNNILITSPVVTPTKIKHLIECIQHRPETLCVVDNLDNLADLNAAGLSAGVTVNVLLDINAGIGRTGVAFEDAIAFAQTIMQYTNISLKGLQCYAGNLQHIHAFDERRDTSLKIMEKASVLRRACETLNLPCAILSGSGTGTYDIDVHTSAITEIQPGSYVVMDVEYANIIASNQQAFRTFKPAMTLLTTVISSNHKAHVTVDAGTKAIYFDPQTKPQIISHTGLNYDWAGFGDEHGKVSSNTMAQLPSNGSVLELIVPHCDPTINLYNEFFIIQNEKVIDVWTIDLRGKTQ